ncbi:MAG: hypothetical protein M3P43_09460 [Actinomycetota bacterium]|nr:hypothetical protein [Actinomycetota bacterium]
MWKELVIGSNRLIDASGVIVVMDKEKVSLERGHDDQLLLTMDVYNADGKHVAKLRRNAWAFHGEDFDITTHPSSLTLVHRESGVLVAEAQVLDRDRVVLPRADFFAATGDRIVVTPDAIRVGGLTMAGNVFQGTNSMLTIGSGFVGIG